MQQSVSVATELSASMSGMMRGPKSPGVDLANLNVQVTLRRLPQLSANLVEYYVNLVNSAQTLISTFQTITNQLVSPETYSNLLLQSVLLRHKLNGNPAHALIPGKNSQCSNPSRAASLLSFCNL